MSESACTVGLTNHVLQEVALNAHETVKSAGVFANSYSRETRIELGAVSNFRNLVFSSSCGISVPTTDE